MKSMPNAIKVVSSNPPHGEVYLIQHYVKVCNITEILLKLVLNTITHKDARFIMVYKIANEQVAIAKEDILKLYL